jgi:hypothetical protein
MLVLNVFLALATNAVENLVDKFLAKLKNSS